jgi:hypothetical protein
MYTRNLIGGSSERLNPIIRGIYFSGFSIPVAAYCFSDDGEVSCC